MCLRGSVSAEHHCVLQMRFEKTVDRQTPDVSDDTRGVMTMRDANFFSNR